MRTLFVCSGNSKEGIGNVVLNQGESLRNQGIQLDYFTIKGTGLNGYLKNIPILNKFISNNTYDIIHAHYSLSAIIAALALFFKGKSMRSKLVVSLMGSDAYLTGTMRVITLFFYRFIWKMTIVKSPAMKNVLGMHKAEVLPNGVDMNRFWSFDKEDARKKIGYYEKDRLILFIANPARPEKNYQLTIEAVKILGRKDTRLLTLHDIPNESIPDYLNAVDVILLSSLWEGSPNIIKEAMACNCPVVATDVGDIAWLFGNEPGHFIADFTPTDFAEKIKMALDFSEKHGRTNGRQRIIELGLDSKTIAKKILSVYQSVHTK